MSDLCALATYSLYVIWNCCVFIFIVIYLRACYWRHHNLPLGDNKPWPWLVLALHKELIDRHSLILEGLSVTSIQTWFSYHSMSNSVIICWLLLKARQVTLNCKLQRLCFFCEALIHGDFKFVSLLKPKKRLKHLWCHHSQGVSGKNTLHTFHEPHKEDVNLETRTLFLAYASGTSGVNSHWLEYIAFSN